MNSEKMNQLYAFLFIVLLITAFSIHLCWVMKNTSAAENRLSEIQENSDMFMQLRVKKKSHALISYEERDLCDYLNYGWALHRFTETKTIQTYYLSGLNLTSQKSKKPISENEYYVKNGVIFLVYENRLSEKGPRKKFEINEVDRFHQIQSYSDNSERFFAECL